MMPWATPLIMGVAQATAVSSTGSGSTLLCPGRHPQDGNADQPEENERDLCLHMLQRVNRNGRPLKVIGDKGYVGQAFKTRAAGLDATILLAGSQRRKRPRGRERQHPGADPRQPNHRPHPAHHTSASTPRTDRQRIESIYWTARPSPLESHLLRSVADGSAR